MTDALQSGNRDYTPGASAADAGQFSWLVDPGAGLLHIENLPLRTALVWDDSVSMKGRTEALERALRRYLASLSDGEKAQLIHFSNSPTVLLDDFSADLAKIDGALEGKFVASGSTALGDALRAALELMKDVDGRRVIILFTDGQDTSSSEALHDLAQRVSESGVQVHTIGLGASLANYSRRMNGTGTQFLERIARAGNGDYHFAETEDRIGPIFAEIAARLRSAPAYGFRVAASPGAGELEVRSVGERIDSLSPPRVQLVLDGSGSMRTALSDGRTRMDVAKDAVVLPDDHRRTVARGGDIGMKGILVAEASFARIATSSSDVGDRELLL